jgi:RNA polymerase sigma-70 factor (ECF subfamily)
MTKRCASFENMLDDPHIRGEGELLRLMLTGDEDAFTALYRRRQGAIYRFALQMSGSASTAEDVTQEVFIALIKGGADFDPSRGSVAAYLYGIARNHVLRRLARDRHWVSLSDSDDVGIEQGEPDNNAGGGPTLKSSDNPLAECARNETIDLVRSAVLNLPTRYREVVVLCDLHELTYADAAEALGCAVGTVRSRLHRARKLLSEKLKSSRSDIEGEPADTERCVI